jgi:hypothetical protein
MIRLHLTVEGDTEDQFVTSSLQGHLAARQVYADSRLVFSGKKKGKTYRGGMFAAYEKIKNDILRWMKEDKNTEARFTTMFDLYALPADFPGYREAEKLSDPYQKVSKLEEALSLDFGDPRFIPYIQLHEFEALILSEPDKCAVFFIEYSRKLSKLIELTSKYYSPELIDEGQQTAPSKRIIQVIPEYEGSKSSAGPIIARHIGLDTIRSKCPHFDRWLKKLEILPQIDLYGKPSNIIAPSSEIGSSPMQ